MFEKKNFLTPWAPPAPQSPTPGEWPRGQNENPVWYVLYLSFVRTHTKFGISDFIWPFLPPYMGVIPNPKMAFIFPISCILVLIFPIFMIYFPKCEGKGSFPKSQIKSLGIKIFEIDFVIEIKWYLTFWPLLRVPGGGAKKKVIRCMPHSCQ